jgi:nucleoside phosphorylase
VDRLRLRLAIVESIDALVVTALPEEFAAAQEVATAAMPHRPGVQRWREHAEDERAPYVAGEYVTAAGRRLSVALARPPRMGGRTTAPMVTALVDRLRPTCLAMCGVCAGNPDETAHGDVVVAEAVFEYDEGLLTDDGFLGDHRQYPQDTRWVRHAQELDHRDLPSYGPVTAEEAEVWFLERLHHGQNPRTHPARRRYFPAGTWHTRLQSLADAGLIEFDNGDDAGWALTAEGTHKIRRLLADDVDGPTTLPLAVLTGPIASGSAVVTEAGIWDRLKAMGVRRVAALEMEAATIVTIAHERAVPHWLVAKGVMDRADKHKDDRYRHFAARASAEVLFRLLGELVPGRPSSAPAPPPPTVPGPVKVAVVRQLTFDWLDLADLLGVPPFARARFPRGDEPRGLWEWLDNRGRLGELPDALAAIGRDDLASLLRSGLA